MIAPIIYAGRSAILNRINILAIVGSFRKGSYNRQLALAAKEIIGGQTDFSLLEYQDIP
jgi:chromate reductase